MIQKQMLWLSQEQWNTVHVTSDLDAADGSEQQHPFAFAPTFL